MARAWHIEGGFGIERLALAELPSRALGPTDVRVKVEALALNYRDLLLVRGEYDPRLPLPHVPGSDAAGVVVEVGSAVRTTKAGDRVVTVFAPEWPAGTPSTEVLRSALGGALPGTFREELVVPAHHVLPAPGHLSALEAATLPCAAVTAWHALVERGALRAGQSVLVQGSGGVSLFALQIAKLSGCDVLATSRSAEKAARLEALGAREVVETTTEPAWAKRVRTLTGGRGVDHVVEVGGARTLGESLKAVAAGGHVHVIGVLSGSSEPLSILPILMNELTLNGIMVGSRASAQGLYRALEAGGVRPVLDRTFPFGALPDALRHMEGQGHFGKIVLAV
jgi:NADPH:quinone reductase-like Zn-dependent oxidoreductase